MAMLGNLKREIDQVAKDKPDDGSAEAEKPEDDGPATQAEYDTQLENLTIITGTPESVIPKIRHVLEYLRPGSIFSWDGDGAMSHEDSMRSRRLMGEEILPAVREIADELDLPSPFEVSPFTNEPVEDHSAAAAEAVPAGDD